jgi:pteridine reductase
MQLRGKVALVTGGAVRLGRAITLSLAEQGAHLVIHYHSSDNAAHQLVDQLVAKGTEALLLQADLGQPGQPEWIIDHALGCFGQLDILINNAALFESGNWDSTTESSWDQHFAVNLKAPFFLSQALARHVGERGRAHIISIADWRGVRPGADHVAYTLTKAALIALTKSLALALAPRIQVNAVAPGIILPPPSTPASVVERWQRRIPAQEIGSPSEISEAVIYLLHSDYVTGELLYVTGGEHLSVHLPQGTCCSTGDDFRRTYETKTGNPARQL